MSQILEGLIDAGVKVGPAMDLASVPAVQVQIDSSQLIQETKEHPSEIKCLVKSPTGAEISALHSFERGGLNTMFRDAVEIA